MASIKQRKSKGKAWWPDDCGSLYYYRKSAFAGTPPAKILKPVRVLKLAAQRALAAWEQQHDTHSNYPYDQVAQWDVAKRSQGAGYATRAVQAWAAAA
jgi:hypothetical protein